MTTQTDTTETRTTLAEAERRVELRDALMMERDAQHGEVIAELNKLPRAAACGGCREGEDGRGHSMCSAYHPAWDLAEALGLAAACLDWRGWRWELYEDDQ